MARSTIIKQCATTAEKDCCQEVVANADSCRQHAQQHVGSAKQGVFTQAYLPYGQSLGTLLQNQGSLALSAQQYGGHFDQHRLMCAQPETR